MDHAGPRLEGRAQPLRHHLRKSAAGELSREMKTRRQNRAMETVEKQTAFSHRSHSPYCCQQIMMKSSDPKTTTTVYTKSLTLPVCGTVFMCGETHPISLREHSRWVDSNDPSLSPNRTQLTPTVKKNGQVFELGLVTSQVKTGNMIKNIRLSPANFMESNQ